MEGDKFQVHPSWLNHGYSITPDWSEVDLPQEVKIFLNPTNMKKPDIKVGAYSMHYSMKSEVSVSDSNIPYLASNYLERQTQQSEGAENKSPGDELQDVIEKMRSGEIGFFQDEGKKFAYLLGIRCGNQTIKISTTRDFFSDGPITGRPENYFTMNVKYVHRRKDDPEAREKRP